MSLAAFQAKHALPAPAVGDRVVVMWGRDLAERELIGYLLDSTEGTVRIAANPDDDGRDLPLHDWWRSAFVADDVRVLRLGGPKC